MKIELLEDISMSYSSTTRQFVIKISWHMKRVLLLIQIQLLKLRWHFKIGLLKLELLRGYFRPAPKFIYMFWPLFQIKLVGFDA